jgi:hypothetical protein
MPRYVITRWIPEENKHVVEHYGVKESEVTTRWEVLIERHGEHNLALFIEYRALSNKLAHNSLKSILKGVKRDK